jgi:hypothetical protein
MEMCLKLATGTRFIVGNVKASCCHNSINAKAVEQTLSGIRSKENE